MKYSIRFGALLSAFVLLNFSIFAQTAGALDTSFGPSMNGEIFLDAPETVGLPNHYVSLLQADGKIVSLLGDNDDSDAVRNLLVRLNADGTVDGSFGSAGYVYLTMGGNGKAFTLGKQMIGGEERFVVAGVGPCGQRNCLRAERYTSAGALDPTFGTNGVTLVATDTAQAMAIQPADQKILFTNTGGTVVRLNANGTADSSFGTGGVLRVAGMGILGVGTQGDRILVCGWAAKGKSNDFAVARLNSNGSLDDGGRSDSTRGDSFGTAGKATVDFDRYNEVAYSISTDATGRLVVTGQAQFGGSAWQNYNAVIVRFSASGQLDTSFGTLGKVILDIGGLQDLFTSGAIQSDGKIVVAGEGRFAGHKADFLVARYNPDGSVDPSFGNGGFIMKDFYSAYEQAQSVLLQSEPGCAPCEKIVVAGSASLVDAPGATDQAVVFRLVP